MSRVSGLAGKETDKRVVNRRMMIICLPFGLIFFFISLDLLSGAHESLTGPTSLRPDDGPQIESRYFARIEGQVEMAAARPLLTWTNSSSSSQKGTLYVAPFRGDRNFFVLAGFLVNEKMKSLPASCSFPAGRLVRIGKLREGRYGSSPDVFEIPGLIPQSLRQAIADRKMDIRILFVGEKPSIIDGILALVILLPVSLGFLGFGVKAGLQNWGILPIEEKPGG